MRIIGHHGARGYEPENTLRSFKRAIDQGADMVEFDVRRAKDGLVVIHDDTLDRTTNETGPVSGACLLEYLLRIRAGDDRVPEFAAAVEYVIERNTPVNVEMKSSGIAPQIAKCLRWMVTRGFPAAERSVVSSFDLDELRAFQRLLPWYMTAALIEERPPWSHPAVRHARSINSSLAITDGRFVLEAHARGKDVNAYTVNEDSDFARMRDLGVDGIFTDYPDRALRFFGR